MRVEAKALRAQIVQICWYMRGSINWEQAWQLSVSERKAMLDLIEENIERTKKSKMPLL